MRDLVCTRGGKLLLGFAGDALLLVELTRQVFFRVLGGRGVVDDGGGWIE
jgi:hypothetical protein